MTELAHSRASKAGYSVFEVLVAFGIMSLVLSALIPGQARFLRHADNSAAKIIAHDVALSRLAPYGILKPLVPGQTEQILAEWTVSETVVAGSAGLYVVTVEVANAADSILATETALHIVP